MKVAEVKAFGKRVAAIQRKADDEITAVFDEIRKQMGWPTDAQVSAWWFSKQSASKQSAVWWVDEDGSTVNRPLGKQMAQALIAMGFPSGS